MTPESAIDVAKRYSSDWGTLLSQLHCVRQVRPWWRFFRLTVVCLEVSSDAGHGTMLIHHRWGVREFYFELSNPKGHMHPMWAAFPGHHMTNMFWRNGDMMPPERYKYAWHYWYRGLTSDEQNDYQRRFPAPSDWERFYSLVAGVPAQPQSLTDYFYNRVP